MGYLTISSREIENINRGSNIHTQVVAMEDTDTIMSEYYGKHIVTALIGITCDTSEIENVSKALVEYNNVEDVFLTTGDYDIIVKVKFPEYSNLKEFILNELSKLKGITKTETMLVVSTYKERGIKFE
jgi:DNA-binding Lrp family transcriptional regulator